MMPNQISADQSEINCVFIHSKIDDFGLSLAQFRIYCHLSRRAKDGVAFPGVDSMCRVCQVSKPTAIDALRTLERRRMLIVQRSPGNTNHYILTKPSLWIDDLDTSTSKKEVTVDQSNPGNATSKKEVTHQSNPGNATSKKEVTKGYPIKDIQLRQSSLRSENGENPFLTLLRQELNTMFKRPPNAPWNYLEQSGLVEVAARSELLIELDELKTYRSRNTQFFPRSIEKLLCSWSKTVDEARSFRPKKRDRGF